MARYRCSNCKQEGQFAYAGVHACPVCSSKDVQFALIFGEFTDDDRVVTALMKLAEDGTDD
jgi:hypothetical protein